MSRHVLVVTLLVLSTVSALAQIDPDKLPLSSASANTNPEVLSDVNAQLIWLLAATAKPGGLGGEEYMDSVEAGMLIRTSAFGTLNQDQQRKLASILSQFRASHDSLAADYDSRISVVGREGVGKEYRDFRLKVNSLVSETMRTLNSSFPDSAASLRSAIQSVRKNTFVSTVKGPGDPNSAADPRNAETGFVYFQGAVVNSAIAGGEKLTFITVVMIGMVPGCPGKPFPTANVGSLHAQGPQIGPLEYMNYQTLFKTTAERPQYFVAVQCANSIPR